MHSVIFSADQFRLRRIAFIKSVDDLNINKVSLHDYLKRTIPIERTYLSIAKLNEVDFLKVEKSILEAELLKHLLE